MERKQHFFLKSISNFCIFLFSFFLLSGISSAGSSLVFQSETLTKWNYFGTFLNLCGNGGWPKVSQNVSVRVSIQDTNSYTTGGASYVLISIDRIKNINFSDGLIGFSLPEQLNINYEKIKIIFKNLDGTIVDVTNSFNPCTQAMSSFIKDFVLESLIGKIASQKLSDAYNFISGFSTALKECGDTNLPFSNTVFLKKFGWDQTLLPYEEPNIDDYSGGNIRIVIPIRDKTRSQVLSLFYSKAMAIHGNLKCNAIDNINCSDTGRIIFTKQISLYNIEGNWTVTQTATNTCSNNQLYGNGIYTGYNIAQSGNSIIVTRPDGTVFTGQRNGNTVSWSGFDSSHDYGGYSWNETVTFNLTSDRTVYGTAQATWTNQSVTCRSSAQFTAQKD
jgi:hypothetical protein